MAVVAFSNSEYLHMPTMHYIYFYLYGVGADRSVGVGRRLPGGIARGVFVAM